MASDELRSNMRRNMVHTLMDLSSAIRQREYQRAVPYVHVPIELACQWEQFSDLLRDQQWFRGSLTHSELEAAKRFDARFKKSLHSFEEKLPQLDVLLDNSSWQQIGRDAAEALAAFQ